jgi:hypothetical protein
MIFGGDPGGPEGVLQQVFAMFILGMIIKSLMIVRNNDGDTQSQNSNDAARTSPHPIGFIRCSSAPSKLIPTFVFNLHPPTCYPDWKASNILISGRRFDRPGFDAKTGAVAGADNLVTVD